MNQFKYWREKEISQVSDELLPLSGLECSSHRVYLVEKCLNFNFKLTGALLFIQEEQREGKIFFTRKTSVFKLNEYCGELGSKVQSYYEMYIFQL